MIATIVSCAASSPVEDAALSALPDAQAGSGAGIYKVASSLGASFGVAISATVFTAMSEGSRAVEWIEGVISYVGRQDNVEVREAAFFALGVNLLFVVLADHLHHGHHPGAKARGRDRDPGRGGHQRSRRQHPAGVTWQHQERSPS